MLKEFREFLEKFNVIPIAVGLVLALAFQPMVNAVVALILSIVARIFGMEPNDDGVYSIAEVDIAGIEIGPLIDAIFTFVLISFVVFMIVKSLAKAGAQTTLNETPDQVLLGEIRDLLKSGR